MRQDIQRLCIRDADCETTNAGFKFNLRDWMDSKKFASWVKEKRISSQIEKGSVYLKNVFKNCLNAKNEKVLIISDWGHNGNFIASILAGGYYSAAKDLELNAALILQNEKISMEPAEPKIVDALDNLSEGNIVVLSVSNKLGEIKKIGKSFRRFAKERKHKFISATGLGVISNDKLPFVLNSINIDYCKLHEKQQKIKHILDHGKEIHVSTDAGTDLYINIRNCESISNDGKYDHPGSGGNIPAGEVYIPPVRGKSNGKLVIDASSRNQEGTLLIKKPITLTIEKGKITDIRGGIEAELLEISLNSAEERSKYPERVRSLGEFGIGTNPNAKIIGSMLVDEKVIGTAHAGIGSNYWFGGDIKTIVHFDQVFRSPKIEIDNEKLNVFK